MTENQIAMLVDRFYAKVRSDERLGPVFNAAIGDWPAHLAKLSDFWSSAMLTTFPGKKPSERSSYARSSQVMASSRWPSATGMKAR